LLFNRSLAYTHLASSQCNDNLNDRCNDNPNDKCNDRSNDRGNDRGNYPFPVKNLILNLHIIKEKRLES